MMQIIVLTNESLKEELLANGTQPGVELVFISNVNEFSAYTNASAFIDLLFENKKERVQILESLLPATVIINSVEHRLTETNSSFIRINGWNTFLQSAIIEASASEEQKQKAEIILLQFNKKIEWLPDEAGFITPRVISAIINEAFIALEEGVSTKEEIDKAMKLGTNYPYGPFEWADKIGLKNITSLLTKLSVQQNRYTPSPLLKQQAQ
jgi:3-hydroxybutyryl-CoA dehydrogenase